MYRRIQGKVNGSMPLLQMARRILCFCRAPGPWRPELRPFLRVSEEPQPREQRGYGLEGSSRTSSEGTSLVSGPRWSLLRGWVLSLPRLTVSSQERFRWDGADAGATAVLPANVPCAVRLGTLQSLLGLCLQRWSHSPQGFVQGVT